MPPTAIPTSTATPLHDPVVAELDLFLSRSSADQKLHVLQYPLRHSRIGVGADRRVTAVNIRPQHARLEVKLAVFPDDPATAGDPDGFDCGQPCAHSFDSAQLDAHEKAIGQTQTLRSRPHLTPPDCNYAIAALVHPPPDSTNATPAPVPAFVLTPVHAVSQLRPAFDYLDAQDLSSMRTRAEERLLRAHARGETVPADAANANADSSVAPLQVSFRRRESERAAERRRNSHASMREREELEPWVDLHYYPASSEDSRRRRLNLFNSASTTRRESGATSGDAIVRDKANYTELFQVHTKGVRVDVAGQGVIDVEESSARALKQLSTSTAVAQVIAYARIASFHDISRLIGDRPAKEVLNAVRAVALCLRGCWVAKKGAKDMRRQASANERYEACRSLIIGLFRVGRIVKTKEAEQAVGEELVISEATVVSILKEVAEFHRGVGWELKVKDDDHFMSMNSTLFRAQDAEWDKREAAAREHIARVLRTSKRRQSLQ